MSGNFNMSFDPKVRQEFADVLSGYGLTSPKPLNSLPIKSSKPKPAFIL